MVTSMESLKFAFNHGAPNLRRDGRVSIDSTQSCSAIRSKFRQQISTIAHLSSKIKGVGTSASAREVAP
jgi:UDP-3-O-acyl-N-acetylglucosamine deacetylase